MLARLEATLAEYVAALEQSGADGDAISGRGTAGSERI